MIDPFDFIRPDLALVERKLRQGAEAMYGPLAEAMLSILESGGKRLRPALVVLAARFHPGVAIERVVALAAAVETLHTATLVHDDLIDGARTRRGHQTLSSRWSSAGTVLAGDYLFARAARFAAETDHVEVQRIFAETLMTICDGELRQLFGAFDLDQDIDSYYLRIFCKTASLFASSMETGSLLSGADRETIQTLRDYGRFLGMSFQIEDDILDFIGDERVMGKPTGGDLHQGIVTLPVYYYLREHADAREPWKARLSQTGAARDAAVDELVSAIRQSPAISACQAESRSFALKARAALAGLPEIEEKRRLENLVGMLLERTH